MNNPPDIEAIVKGLSEAESRAILDCDFYNDKWWLPFSRGVASSLRAKGLTDDNVVWYWLNDTGLLVRSHISERAGG